MFTATIIARTAGQTKLHRLTVSVTDNAPGSANRVVATLTIECDTFAEARAEITIQLRALVARWNDAAANQEFVGKFFKVAADGTITTR